MGNKTQVLAANQKQDNLILALQLGVEKDILALVDRLAKEEPACISAPINKVRGSFA